MVVLCTAMELLTAASGAILTAILIKTALQSIPMPALNTQMDPGDKHLRAVAPLPLIGVQDGASPGLEVSDNGTPNGMLGRAIPCPVCTALDIQGLGLACPAAVLHVGERSKGMLRLACTI